MKKKLILMLSMVALLACLFAVSVSASNYIEMSEFFYTEGDTTSFSVFLNTTSHGEDFVSKTNDVFGVIEVDVNTDSFFGFYNIEWWHTYLSALNVVTEEDFESAINLLVDNEYMCSCSSGVYFYTISDISSYFNAYKAYVAELNTPTYEQGKTDGVTEYKSSTEYNTALNEKYVEGKADGIEYFKNSTEYENTLSVKYATGLADGKTNYIESDEYAIALKTEYDSGYSDGVAVTEDEASESKANNTFGIALGASLILILVVVVLYFSPKRKRRR